MNNLHTHYDTLMVSRYASPEVIRAAFKSLSQKYHPDKNNHPDADRIMQQFNESWIQHRSATHPNLDFTSSGVLNPSTFLGRLFKLSSID